MTKKPFQVIVGGRPAEKLLPVPTKANARTFDAMRVAKFNARPERATGQGGRAREAILCRKLAHKVRTLMYEVEDALNLDGSKLRAYALHLENIAERWSGQ